MSDQDPKKKVDVNQGDDDKEEEVEETQEADQSKIEEPESLEKEENGSEKVDPDKPVEQQTVSDNQNEPEEKKEAEESEEKPAEEKEGEKDITKEIHEDKNVEETTDSNEPEKEIIKPETEGEHGPQKEEEKPKEVDKIQSKTESAEVEQPSSPTSRNLEAIQAALDSKSNESGFMLTSQFAPAQTSSTKDASTQDDSKAQEQKVKLSTTKVKFQTGLKPDLEKKKTYLTETSVESEEKKETQHAATRESRTYSPAYIDTAVRKSDSERKLGRKGDTRRSQLLQRLGLKKPPEKYVRKLQPPKQDPDPNNKVPLNPNIYITEVPKEGGEVKTPFYMQVDIPDGTLEGDIRLKFEKQEFDLMKLGLSNDDKLCSYIVDLNPQPLGYCLHKNATVKMRILNKCINKYDNVIIITARHFSWVRIPTKVESRSINGEEHFYAVTEVQCFGKFAVINTKRMDRFVITDAGGKFHSTIQPEICLRVDEALLHNYTAQMIELKVQDTKLEAVKKMNRDMGCIEDIKGKLVSASPLIEISKEFMGDSGNLPYGVQFLEKITLQLPVPKPQVTAQKNGFVGNRSVIVMQKLTPSKPVTLDGHRYYPDAYGACENEEWVDVTEENNMATDGVAFTEDELISLDVYAPGKYTVLVFEEGETQATDGRRSEIGELTESLLEANNLFDVNVMIHQKVSQPSLLFIHIVTSDAVEPIRETMRKTNAWKRVYVSQQLVMREWQPIKIEFKGDVRPTVNQMSLNVRFYSRRWQGYQIQVEATEEAFNKVREDSVTGKIIFMKNEKDRTTSDKVSPEMYVLCSSELELPRESAKPFKPTIVVKKVPKVPIYREYKMKWLKNLSDAEKEKYKAMIQAV